MLTAAAAAPAALAKFFRRHAAGLVLGQQLGRSLAVKEGEQVIPVINRIAKGFENVVMTQDWHTPHHISFASSHEGKKPFEVIKLAYGDQVLWPDHKENQLHGR